jgi:putative AlgH/UPF0301 family transcriptional regulator
MFQRQLHIFAVLATIIALASASGVGPSVNAPSAMSEIPSATFLPVQARNVHDLGAGKLLVASRDLADPNFAQTVVLLVRYDAEGVVGLILNRRTDVPLSKVLKDLKAARDRSDRVYLGGPVERPAVLALLRSTTRLEGAPRIFDGTYLIASKDLFEQTVSKQPDAAVFHVYLGYAGWAKEQLQMEVALGAWFIFQADNDTVFNLDPDSLWQHLIRKTELKMAQGESMDTDQCTFTGHGSKAARRRVPRLFSDAPDA